ncbi:MAG: serine hydrolase domain-containing protein [Stappiaceae bacterium]
MTSCDQNTQLRSSEQTSQAAARLDERMPELMRRNGVSGIGVAVIRGNEATLIKHFGIADDRSHTPMETDTVFEVASLGKPVFGYVSVSLSQSGLFELDEPLVKYVPDLFSDPDPRLGKITARMILSHSSGLPNFGSKSPDKLLFDPGADFAYSGVGFEKLQRALETLAGKPLNQMAAEIVFQPFGMTSTSYVWNEGLGSRLALGHDSNGKQADQHHKPERGNAAWSLYSTTADYARFVEKLMREDDSVANAMIAPQIQITDEISWGLGWGLQSTKPNPSLWHWGSNSGYKAYIVGYPAEKIAVVVLSNSDEMFKLIEDTVQMTIGGDLPSFHWF